MVAPAARCCELCTLPLLHKGSEHAPAPLCVWVTARCICMCIPQMLRSTNNAAFACTSDATVGSCLFHSPSLLPPDAGTCLCSAASHFPCPCPPPALRSALPILDDCSLIALSMIPNAGVNPTSERERGTDRETGRHCLAPPGVLVAEYWSQSRSHRPSVPSTPRN